jgi:hypothetical protein
MGIGTEVGADTGPDAEAEADPEPEPDPYSEAKIISVGRRPA